MPKATKQRVTLKCLHVKAGEKAVFPRGYTIHHSTLVEPSRGKPYFAVLLTNEHHKSEGHPAIGFHVDEDDE